MCFLKQALTIVIVVKGRTTKRNFDMIHFLYKLHKCSLACLLGSYPFSDWELFINKGLNFNGTQKLVTFLSNLQYKINVCLLTNNQLSYLKSL